MSRDASRIVIRNGRDLEYGRALCVVISDGIMTSIGSDASQEADLVLDLDGAFLVTGYVDLQVNGFAGDDITAHPASMWAVGEAVRTTGVTAFLPTLVSTDLDRVQEARRTVAEGPPNGYTGAAIWGLHVEGPFLAPARRGAHDAGKLRLPAPELVGDWSPASGVVMATLAPELPGALDTIAALSTRGVVVSAGHSDATYEEAIAGFAAGARSVTHLFNAMSGCDHRNPGLATAALAHPTAVAGMIVDGVHLHPGTVAAAFRALGPNRTLLVTDAVAATGTETASSRLGSLPVSVATGAPRLPSGVLAGSVLTLDRAVRNLMTATGCTLADAVAGVTSTPRSLLGRAATTLTVGAKAELTAIDEAGMVLGTVIGGNVSPGLEALDVAR